jgi:Uma2 family endonuclease
MGAGFNRETRGIATPEPPGCSHELRHGESVKVTRPVLKHVFLQKRLMALLDSPEIVIEVLSPSNTATEMLDKEQICMENGAKEFWVVDIDRRQVKVSTPDGRTVAYKFGQEIPLQFAGKLAVDEIFRG